MRLRPVAAHRATRRRVPTGATSLCLFAAFLLVCTTDLPPAGAVPGAARTTPLHASSRGEWTPVTFVHGVVAVERRVYRLGDGHAVTMYRFEANQVRFALHTGSLDPPGVASHVGPAGAPWISPIETPHLVAAFNGGFMVATGSGGFEVNRRVFVALQGGVESLVINSDGSAEVGSWGCGVPLGRKSVVSVRQNLPALVSNGRLSPNIGDVNEWGATENGVPLQPRSALGIDRHGNLVYAASMASFPVDIGVALQAAGVFQAMELDINPGWVQMDSATRPGGPLVAGIPSQTLPSNQYELGWTRDFITVMARK